MSREQSASLEGKRKDWECLSVNLGGDGGTNSAEDGVGGSGDQWFVYSGGACRLAHSLLPFKRCAAATAIAYGRLQSERIQPRDEGLVLAAIFVLGNIEGHLDGRGECAKARKRSQQTKR